MASYRARASLAFVTALISCLALAGCDNANPTPAPLPSQPPSSPSPSPDQSATPSPDEAPPTLPAAAEGTSEKSAKAFVRHWIRTLNYAGPAGDPAQLDSLNAEDCAACDAIVELIQEVDAAGGYIRGRGWVPLAIRALPSPRKEIAIVDATVRVNPQRVVVSKGKAPEIFEGARRLKTFWLARGNEGWRVTRLDQPT